jgi:hypothetical protein
MDSSLFVAAMERIRACPFEANDLVALRAAIDEDGEALGSDLIEWAGGW